MTRRTPWAEYERAVRLYTDAGAAETVQRIVTAVSRISRRLDVFYGERFDALDLSRAEWSVLQALAVEGRHGHSNPSRLPEAGGGSASPMTPPVGPEGRRGVRPRLRLHHDAPVGPDGRARARPARTRPDQPHPDGGVADPGRVGPVPAGRAGRGDAGGRRVRAADRCRAGHTGPAAGEGDRRAGDRGPSAIRRP